MTSTIVIEPYRAEWPAEFQRLASLVQAIAPAGSEVHHIGSTAVAGLSAKDVIDLQLTVQHLGDIDPGAFMEVGFEPVAGGRDHSPPGLVLAHAELEKLFFRSRSRPAHLHVREVGRFNQRYALLCRDFLISSPEAAAAYEAVKIELAARFRDDPAAYYAIKDPVFDVLMAGAEVWAEATGWRAPPAG